MDPIRASGPSVPPSRSPATAHHAGERAGIFPGRSIVYRSDPEALRRVVPEPLEIGEPLVRFEVIRMPDSTAVGDYTESGQVVAVTYNGSSQCRGGPASESRSTRAS